MNSYLIVFYPKGSPLLCNRIPKGNTKPELNQIQAIYLPEGPKSKVCATTAINNVVFSFYDILDTDISGVVQLSRPLNFKKMLRTFSGSNREKIK